ncbi:hypothetical protein BDY17DRAFT_327078 [Neohortaea acidophila]|uniref:Uncharacterized protein n=1 Tax=Neohortaea acidophila TaxID=245834 RepID=A0A6A6PKA4_9PEZI|nr:uncharacterized protein BDY17DRAFT_327078 [Neohortaea acidophila]KAF2480094.1 hypothetical protein BDY17DRAFT_327078 [Neohortaea acidophila]
MSEIEDGLLAIEVDTDDAESGDAPVESRTFQSETDFERQKAAYAAKVDGGKAYKDLMVAVPVLDPAHDCIRTNGHAKSKLTKKDVQLLGYAVAQLLRQV